MTFSIPKTPYKIIFSAGQNNIFLSSQEMYNFSQEIGIGNYENVVEKQI